MATMEDLYSFNKFCIWDEILRSGIFFLYIALGSAIRTFLCGEAFCFCDFVFCFHFLPHGRCSSEVPPEMAENSGHSFLQGAVIWLWGGKLVASFSLDPLLVSIAHCDVFLSPFLSFLRFPSCPLSTHIALPSSALYFSALA